MSLTFKLDIIGFCVSIILSKYNEHLSEPKKENPKSSKFKKTTQNKDDEKITENTDNILIKQEESPKINENINKKTINLTYNSPNFDRVDADIITSNEQRLKNNINKIDNFVPYNPMKKMKIIDETKIPTNAPLSTKEDNQNNNSNINFNIPSLIINAKNNKGK